MHTCQDFAEVPSTKASFCSNRLTRPLEKSLAIVHQADYGGALACVLCPSRNQHAHARNWTTIYLHETSRRFGILILFYFRSPELVVVSSSKASWPGVVASSSTAPRPGVFASSSTAFQPDEVASNSLASRLGSSHA